MQIKLKTTFATFFQSTHCWFNKTFAQAMNIVYMSDWILRFHYESNYKCDFGLKSRIWFQIKLHSTQFQLPFLIFIGCCHLTRATVGSGGVGESIIINVLVFSLLPALTLLIPFFSLFDDQAKDCHSFHSVFAHGTADITDLSNVLLSCYAWTQSREHDLMFSRLSVWWPKSSMSSLLLSL